MEWREDFPIAESVIVDKRVQDAASKVKKGGKNIGNDLIGSLRRYRAIPTIWCISRFEWQRTKAFENFIRKDLLFRESDNLRATIILRTRNQDNCSAAYDIGASGLAINTCLKFYHSVKSRVFDPIHTGISTSIPGIRNWDVVSSFKKNCKCCR